MSSKDYAAITMASLRHLGHDPVEYYPVVGSPRALCRHCTDGWTLRNTELQDADDIVVQDANGMPDKTIGKPIVPQWQGPRRPCPGAGS